MANLIRAVLRSDLPALEDIIRTSELFPSELLSGMMDNYFSDDASPDIWLTLESGEKCIAVAYCAPERLTDGTYNLYLIAVHKNFQGKGIGSSMMSHIETLLIKKGGRILIVETSGLPDFELTRNFYIKCQYHTEAVIRDYYKEGENKIIFWKKLVSS